MNLIKEFFELKQFILNTSEVTISLVPLTGIVDRCTKFGVDIVAGNLYYVDEGNMWKLYIPSGGIDGPLLEYENNAAAIAAGHGEAYRYRLPYNNGSYAVAYVVLPPPPPPLFTVVFNAPLPGPPSVIPYIQNILFHTTSPITVTVDWGDGQTVQYISAGSILLVSHEYVSVNISGTYAAVFTVDDPAAVTRIIGNNIDYVRNEIREIYNLEVFTNLERLDMQGSFLTSFIITAPNSLISINLRDSLNLTNFDIFFGSNSLLDALSISNCRLTSLVVNRALIKSEIICSARGFSMNLFLNFQNPLAPPTTSQAIQAKANLISLSPSIYVYQISTD